MPLRPCLGIEGDPTRTIGHTLTARAGSRCAPCAALHAAPRQRRKRTRRPYNSAEQRRRAAVVAQHRATFGDLCPGFERPSHRAADLTADHVVPVRAGAPESGLLQVLCRSCNSRKGQRLPR